MRKWSTKRIFVAVAAVCILGTMTAVVAEKMVYISGGDSRLDNSTCDKLREMEIKLGYTANAPETFSNEYRLDMGMPTHQGAIDQDGNVIKPMEGFSLNYKKNGNPDVFITVQGTGLYDEKERPDQTSDHSRIILNYTKDQYRLVPPNYQVSDEEKVKETTGELCISYGSDKVQGRVAQNMLWKDGEEVYIITATDNPMTVQDMTQMAGGLIDDKQ